MTIFRSVMVKQGIRYVWAYVLWIVVLLLALWLLIIGRTDFLGAMAAFYVGDSATHSWQARFFDRVFTLIFGLAWLVFMIVTEASFRQGARRPGLLKRFARIAGPLLVLIFIADLFLLWLQDAAGGNWLRWLALAGELAAGILLLWYARSGFSRSRTQREPGEG